MLVASNTLLLLNLLVGVVLFIHGFLSSSPSFSSVPPDATFANVSSTMPQPHVGRVVFIVIDALRWDFLHPLSTSPMTRTRDLVRKMGFLKRARAAPPTVTLPRIKAIVSGSISGFIDVIVNLNAQTMEKDSWVSRAKETGRRLTLFGDDTWLRLFPDVFERSDGTTSFFVNDYTEVDDNVTRHLDEELRRTDWDVMILHYLGLDHIGHTLGPSSPLIRSKLSEMDGIVEKITTSLVSNTKTEKSALPPLIVICGDHGMSDGGSHGGSSAPETHTPLIFLSQLYEDQNEFAVGSEFRGEPDQVEQVDIAPTLSALLGLPFPSSSIGRVIADALPPKNSAVRLEALRLNLVHLERIGQFAATSDCQNHSFLKSVEGLESASKCVQDVLLSTASDYDLYEMFLAFVLALSACFVSACHIFLDSCALSTSFPSDESCRTRLNYSTSTLKCALAIFSWSFISFHVCRSTPEFSASTLCPPHASPSSALVGIVVWTLISSTVIDMFAALLTASPVTVPKMNLALLLLPIIPAISSGSSSLIEEEHFCWYHLATTLSLGLTVENLRAAYNEYRFARFAVSYDPSPRPSREHVDASNVSAAPFRLVDEEKKLRWQLYDVSWRGAGLLALLRVSRSWNQTGNKWLHFSDVGKALNDPNNVEFLTFAVIAGLLAILWMVVSSEESKLAKFLASLCIPAIYAYHAQSARLYFGMFCSRRGKYEARLVFLLVGIGCFGAAVDFVAKLQGHRQKELATLSLLRKLRLYLILVAALLGKAHNVPLLAMVCWLQELYFAASSALGTSGCSGGQPMLHFVCHWIGVLVMGMCSFFAQGNSNSLSTVHLASGYVGLDNHSIWVAGPMLLMSTYSSFILWILRAGEELSAYTHIQRAERTILDGSRVRRSAKDFKSSFALALLWARGLPLAFYLAVLYIQREHLFVWSVFAPKLLYEGVTTAICVLLSFLISL